MKKNIAALFLLFIFLLTFLSSCKQEVPGPDGIPSPGGFEVGLEEMRLHFQRGFSPILPRIEGDFTFHSQLRKSEYSRNNLYEFYEADVEYPQIYDNPSVYGLNDGCFDNLNIFGGFYPCDNDYSSWNYKISAGAVLYRGYDDIMADTQYDPKKIFGIKSNPDGFIPEAKKICETEISGIGLEIYIQSICRPIVSGSRDYISSYFSMSVFKVGQRENYCIIAPVISVLHKYSDMLSQNEYADFLDEETEKINTANGQQDFNRMQVYNNTDILFSKTDFAQLKQIAIAVQTKFVTEFLA